MKKMSICMGIVSVFFSFQYLFANPELGFKDALREREEIPDQVTPEAWRLSYGNSAQYRDQDSTKETAQRDLKNLRLRASFLPTVLKGYVERAYVELGSSDREGSGYVNNTETDWRDYNNYELQAGMSHKKGSVTFKESLAFHALERSNSLSPSKDERFVGGSLVLDYKDRWSFCFLDQCRTLGVNATTSYNRDRNFVAGVDTKLHELDTYKTKIDVVGSRWLFESIYQNQYLDDTDDYYSTQNTVGLYFAPEGKPGAVWTWVYVTGLQHVKSNLNPHELLGLILEARKFGGTAEQWIHNQYGPSDRQFVIGVMLDPTSDDWNLGKDRGWKFYMGEETDIHGIQFYWEDADGKWGNQNASGWDFFLRF